jgi:hypothetical protein
LPPSKRYANLVLESSGDLPSVEKSLYDAIVGRRALAAKR